MLWWLIAAAGLIGAEFAVSGLVLGFVGLGAAGAAIAAGVGLGIAGQVASFAAVSVGSLVGVRPLLRHRLMRGPAITTGVAALVGHSAEVTETVSDADGRIRLAGEVWSARTIGPAELPVGATVTVVEIDGATAIVV